MILINEVAKKIEDILNGTDPEVAALRLNRPVDYYFKVATEGFHIDRIFDVPEGRNFIPVFISTMGGQFNPVPELLQANYVIPIAIYFPVRFKNDLFRLNEYLARVFVGRQLNYGEESGSALSNISIAQFGEILEMDVLQEYASWEKTTYKRARDVMEPMLQMNFNLYLSTASSDFVYGNNSKATLTIDYDPSDTDLPSGWQTTDATDDVSFVQTSIQSHSDPQVQQLVGSSESEGLPTGTSYATSFSIYIKNKNFYKFLIKKWFKGESQDLSFTLQFEFLGETYTRTVYVQSANLSVQKGELATITLTYAKKAVLS